MLGKWLRDAKYAVAFTGAGMSTESGLPDFRLTNRRLWRNSKMDILTSKMAMNHHKDEFIHFFKQRVMEVREYHPHKCHHIFAEWENKGYIQSVITQNVDGLHRLAGSRRVAELHGTLQELHCNDCGEKYDNMEYMKDKYYCSCGGMIRPSIVLFGENQSQRILKFAIQEAKRADLFLVLGSSLTISPANKLPKLAKKNGARLVIVNQENTPLDPYADVIIQDKSVGELLEEIEV